MKWKIEKKYIVIAITSLIVIVLALLFQHSLEKGTRDFQIVISFRETMMPIFGGIVFAYLLNPVLGFFERCFFTPLAKVIWKKEEKEKTRMKFSRAWGIVFTMITFGIVLFGGLYLVVPQVYQSLVKIMSDAPDYYNSAVKWIDSLDTDKSDVSKYLLMGLNRGYDQAIDYMNKSIIPNMDKIVVSITSGIVVGLKYLLNIILMIVISVYVMAEKEILISVLKKFVYSVFSNKNANAVMRGTRYAHKVFGGFISGKIIDSFIIGTICYLFMTIAGMDYTVLISIIIGVTNIIPYFGPFIGAIPSALILLILDWEQGIIFIIFILILQQIDGNIIGPLILGDRLNLSSMWILFSILIGGGFFGVFGMILGAPCFACIYALVRTICEEKLKKKDLPVDTDVYLTVGSIDDKGNISQLEKQERTEDITILTKKKKVHHDDEKEEE